MSGQDLVESQAKEQEGWRLGGVSLLLPQAREGRKEVLVSGQRMETIPDQPGEAGRVLEL